MCLLLPGATATSQSGNGLWFHGADDNLCVHNSEFYCEVRGYLANFVFRMCVVVVGEVKYDSSELILYVKYYMYMITFTKME